MAQHDMNIANQGFPATRADINNALQALVSNSSGTSAPSTTFANQWWYDTTNNKLYIRNEANNAWIQVAVLDQTANEWQITTGQISAADGDGLVFKTDDGNTRVTLSDGGDVTFADGTDVITASAGTDNVRIGEGAGDSIASGGDNNVVIGKDAGTAISTGDANVAIGHRAGEAITTSSDNVLIGKEAGLVNTASFNIGIGRDALVSNTSGTQNVAIGYRAGQTQTTNGASTFVGNDAGRDNTGSTNCFIGHDSGRLITSGAKNTILGSFDGNQDGLDIRTSSNNVVLSDGDGAPVYVNKKVDTFQTGGRTVDVDVVYSGAATGWDSSASVNTWTTISAINFADSSLVNDNVLEIMVFTQNLNPSYGYYSNSLAVCTNTASNTGYAGSTNVTTLNGTRVAELLTISTTHTQASGFDFRMRIAHVSNTKRLQVYSNVIPSSSAAAPTMRIGVKNLINF